MKNLKTLQFKLQLENNLRDHSPLIQVLLGPRQVGKTTAVLDIIENSLKNKAIYVSADEVFNSSPEWLLENWKKAEIDKKILFIDEIQKCENWSEVIKKLYDENKKNKKNVKCILLGSSSLEIQKGLSESLTGRFNLIQASHWNASESQSAFGMTFEQYLKYGGYPGSYCYMKDKIKWSQFIQQSIISTVIDKDILHFNKVKSPSLFRQAFEILTNYPAHEISLTKLLGQLQDRGNVDLVKYYLKLYEGAFLIKTLEKFHEKKILTKSSSPKIILQAPCLYQLGILDDYSNDEKGRIFENLVGAQLLRSAPEVYYWRQGTFEVDYVVKLGRKLWAIEVKSGRSRSNRGLLEFKKNYNQAEVLFIDEDNYLDFEKDPLQFLLNKA